MKKDDLMKLVLAGKPVLLCEYRSTEKDMVNRKVVKAGESATMPLLKHKVLVGDDSWELGEFPASKEDFDKYKSPYQVRDMVIVQVETMERTKYGTRMQGEILGKLES